MAGHRCTAKSHSRTTEPAGWGRDWPLGSRQEKTPAAKSRRSDLGLRGLKSLVRQDVPFRRPVSPPRKSDHGASSREQPNNVCKTPSVHRNQNTELSPRGPLLFHLLTVTATEATSITPGKRYSVFQLSNFVTQNVTETESHSTESFEVGFIHSAHHLEMSWAERVPPRFVCRSLEPPGPRNVAVLETRPLWRCLR